MIRNPRDALISLILTLVIIPESRDDNPSIFTALISLSVTDVTLSLAWTCSIHNRCFGPALAETLEEIATTTIEVDVNMDDETSNTGCIVLHTNNENQRCQGGD